MPGSNAGAEVAAAPFPEPLSPTMPNTSRRCPCAPQFLVALQAALTVVGNFTCWCVLSGLGLPGMLAACVSIVSRQLPLGSLCRLLCPPNQHCAVAFRLGPCCLPNPCL